MNLTKPSLTDRLHEPTKKHKLNDKTKASIPGLTSLIDGPELS